MRRIGMTLMAMALLVFGSLGYMAGSAHLFSPSQLAAADDCQTFPETGFQVCGDFLTYWRDHSGLSQQGYPIGPTFLEKSDTDGKTYMTQYFERAVFEAHPENQPPYNVLLSLLGSQKYKAKYPNGVSAGGPVATAPQGSVPPPGATGSSPTPSGTHLRLTSGTVAVVQAGSDTQKLTIVKVVDNAKSTNQFNAPKPGNKFIQLEFVFENLGQKDTTSGSWKMQGADGTEYDIGNAAGFGESLTLVQLSQGGKRQGSIVFEVPQAASIKWLRYRLSTGAAQSDVFFDA